MARDIGGSTVGDILRAVDQMTASVEEARQWMDHNRQLPPALVAAMNDAKLFSLWLPSEFDGPELNLVDTARVIESAARVDGAVGWCAGIGTSYSRFAAFLPSSTTQQLFIHSSSALSAATRSSGATVGAGSSFLIEILLAARRWWRTIERVEQAPLSAGVRDQPALPFMHYWPSVR